MRVSKIENSNVVNTPNNEVTNRLNQIRASLKKYGAAFIDLDKEVDVKVLERLKKVHGDDKVIVEYSDKIKVTVEDFK